MKEEKDEGEIFKEWYELNFGEQASPPDPLEYVHLRDTIGFQRYLLWYRYKELEELIREELLNMPGKLISKISSIRKILRKRRKK